MVMELGEVVRGRLMRWVCVHVPSPGAKACGACGGKPEREAVPFVGAALGCNGFRTVGNRGLRPLLRVVGFRVIKTSSS
jgi:hypothetical protein